jgi:hypothetical protein
MIRLQSLSHKWDFQIARHEAAFSEVRYSRNWFSKTARAKVNGQTILIKPLSILNNKFSISKNGRPCGQIHSNWTSRVSLSLKRSDGNGSDHFIISQKGWFGPRWVLKTEAGEPLLRFNSKFNWRTFKFNHRVTEFEHDYPDEAINELLVYSGFAVNLSAMNSGFA